MFQQNYIGKVIGGCTIIREIARGGMGIVYEAEQTSLSRKVAIKILAPQLLDNEDYITRFFREAKAVAGISHPNVLQVIDVGREDDIIYMITELIKGETLSEILDAKGPMSEDMAISIISDVASALSETNKNGIIHRDIKPNNIMISDNNTVKVMDFGLAKQISAQGQTLTQTGAILGTPRYMSPEQITHDANIDIRSDIYSLGLVLFCILTGKHAYESDSVIAILHNNASKPIPDPKKIRTDLSAEVRSLIIKMTKKNPAQRFQTPSKIVDAISLLQNDRKSFSSTYKHEDLGCENKHHKYKPLIITVIIIIALCGIFLFFKKNKTDISTNNSPASQKTTQTYEEYIKAGEQALKAEEWDKAINLFKTAFNHYPEKHETKMWISMAEKKKEKYYYNLVSSEIITPDTLTVLVCPFSNFFYKDKSGNNLGHDIEVMKKFSKKLKLKIKFIEVAEYKDLTPALLTNKADIIAAGMTITDQRKKEIDFSYPYFTNTQVLVTKSGAKIESTNDLTTLSVGYMPGTSYEQTIKRFEVKNTIPLKETKDMADALKKGEIDAFIDDLVSAIDLENEDPSIEIAFTFDKVEHFSYGLKKNTRHLKEALDSFLKESENNGFLKELYNKFFEN